MNHEKKFNLLGQYKLFFNEVKQSKFLSLLSLLLILSALPLTVNVLQQQQQTQQEASSFEVNTPCRDFSECPAAHYCDNPENTVGLCKRLGGPKTEEIKQERQENIITQAINSVGSIFSVVDPGGGGNSCSARKMFPTLNNCNNSCSGTCLKVQNCYHCSPDVEAKKCNVGGRAGFTCVTGKDCYGVDLVYSSNCQKQYADEGPYYTTKCCKKSAPKECPGSKINVNTQQCSGKILSGYFPDDPKNIKCCTGKVTNVSSGSSSSSGGTSGDSGSTSGGSTTTQSPLPEGMTCGSNQYNDSKCFGSCINGATCRQSATNSSIYNCCYYKSNAEQTQNQNCNRCSDTYKGVRAKWTSTSNCTDTWNAKYCSDSSCTTGTKTYEKGSLPSC